MSDLDGLQRRVQDISDRMEAIREDLRQLVIDLDRTPEVAAIRFLTHAAFPDASPLVEEEPRVAGTIVLATGPGSHGGVHVRYPWWGDRVWLGPLGVPGKNVGWGTWQSFARDHPVRVLYTPPAAPNK